MHISLKAEKKKKSTISRANETGNAKRNAEEMLKATPHGETTNYTNKVNDFAVSTHSYAQSNAMAEVLARNSTKQSTTQPK